MRRANWISMVGCFIALALAGAGCVDQVERAPNTPGAWEFGEDGVEEDGDTIELPVVTGVFISGHLGNYMDCPDQGYDAGSDAPGEQQDVPGLGGAGERCDDADECFAGGGPSCLDAQVTLQLKNISALDVEGLQVTTIELFDNQGVSQAVLPLLGVSIVGSEVAFDGSIASESEVMLRVDYQGLQHPWELLAGPDQDDSPYQDYSGTIEITFEGEIEQGVVVIQGGVYTSPSIAT